MKLAQDLQLYDPNTGSLKGFGALGLDNPRNPLEAPVIFSTFISSVIGLISLIAIIWFIINLLTGAISVLTSAGDKNALENAKKKITNSLIGLLITFFSLFVVNFVGWLIGFPGVLGFQALFEQLIIK